MQTIKSKIPSFLKKCLDGIALSSVHNIAQYCQFCGAEKSEFMDPRTERIALLECECERRYSMLQDYVRSITEQIKQREPFALKAVAEVEAMQSDRARLRSLNASATRESTIAR
jgi:hypothetical protein